MKTNKIKMKLNHYKKCDQEISQTLQKSNLKQSRAKLKANHLERK
jgi:hypothetical protein